MRSLAEQIGHRCKHFNGTMNKCCDAGVVYDAVTDKSRKGFERFPCFREGESVPCALRRFLTAEEVAVKVKEHKESFQKMDVAIRSCQEDSKARGFKKGNGGKAVIPCPVCKTGQLHYSVASYNGHLWGKCTTDDCVGWMQ